MYSYWIELLYVVLLIFHSHLQFCPVMRTTLGGQAVPLTALTLTKRYAIYSARLSYSQSPFSYYYDAAAISNEIYYGLSLSPALSLILTLSQSPRRLQKKYVAGIEMFLQLITRHYCTTLLQSRMTYVQYWDQYHSTNCRYLEKDTYIDFSRASKN